MSLRNHGNDSELLVLNPYRWYTDRTSSSCGDYEISWCNVLNIAYVFQFFGAVFASKGYPFKNIFDFTTAGDWDCVAAVERLPALHYNIDFIFLSFGIIGFFVEL